ncbi:MAG TPA: LamG-like jellyroll fold domain-containing protein, partial [bacterium]|nr:LamG-like jellyroll fold domain-containing protein [bacterium]
YATSYNVKRATVSGGPYTTIASVGPNSTYYLDGGLAAGTTNYYVISAVTPSGETANSSEAAGTTANIVGPYYKFDESSGAMASDSSGFGFDGTLVNGPTWTTGVFGNAVNLLGSSSQYVALPTGVISGLGDFTIAGWVNLSTVSAWNRIFDFGVNTDRYMFLTPQAGAGGPVRFAITTAGGKTEEQISGTATLGTGWHHLAVTLTGNEGTGVGTLYVDGVPVGTNSAMSHTPGMIGDLINDANNWIGRSQFSDPYLNGKVDDFRIYNGALNAAGISAIMAGNPPPTQPGPPSVPSAPTGLSAIAVSSSQINLSWTGSTGATSYNVKRSTTNGGPYVVIANILTNLNSTSFSDIGLTDGKTYYYVVTALNDGGESANSSQVSAAPPIPALAGYWKFDEAGGTTAADSAGANNATLAAGATWATGKMNSAVSLNGTSTSYVSFPAGFISTLTNYTIAGWVNLNSVSTWARIFDFGTGTTNYMYLAPSSGSAIRFAINIGGGEQQINGSSIPSTGAWHHFAVTLSGTVGTLYIDGVKAGVNTGMTLSPSSLGSTTQNYLGKSQFADPYLNGLVDDFRIYNSALSAAEVFALVYPPPAAPTGLSATGGDSVVNLAWVQSTGSDITTNRVYRSTTGSGGSYSLLATLAATTSYADTTAVNGSTYYYAISAINTNGESALSSYAGATPAPTLMAYLKLDETSGTTALDSTSNGWSGTLVNSPTWVAGYSNNAVSFNGTNQYVSLPAGVVSSVTNFTMAAWVKPTTVSTWNRILDFGNNTTTYMFLSPKSGSGTVRFAITTSGNAHEQQINGTAALSAGAWSHVVVTLSGSVGILYVNGAPVGTNSAMTLNPSSMGSTANNYLGKSQFNDPYLKGLVDEFRIYKGAMSASQVSSLP